MEFHQNNFQTDKIKLCKDLKQIISDNEEIETSNLYDHITNCNECKEMLVNILTYIRNEFPILKMVITNDQINKLKVKK